MTTEPTPHSALPTVLERVRWGIRDGEVDAFAALDELEEQVENMRRALAFYDPADAALEFARRALNG